MPTKLINSQGSSQGPLRLAIPSDGELHEPSLGFLRACGTPVKRASLRRYTGELDGVPGVTVLLQRSADIAAKVEEGSADLGIVGLDRFHEFRLEGAASLVIVDNLAYGQSQLLVAVPGGWVDVTTMADLADLAVEFREASRELRIATKYPRLVRSFLHSKGITYFSIVHSSGTLEAAPVMGFADVIADIVSTGVTLRENQLKTLEDGVIFTSQAALIGNGASLAASPTKMEKTRILLERIEANMRAREFYQVTANLAGESEEDVAQHLLKRPDIAGIQGPTIARVYGTGPGRWYAATIVVRKARLQEAVDHLREMGGNGVSIFQPNYLFERDCEAYQQLVAAVSSKAKAEPSLV